MKYPVSLFRWVGRVCALFAAVSFHTASALQPGFSSQTILTQFYHPVGITFHPVAMAFLPDGRMLLAQKEGAIMIAEGPDYDTAAIYLDRTTDINFYEERGLMGFAIDPDFSTNGYLYVYYNPISRDFYRIARFTHSENQGGITSRADTTSQLVIWEDIENYHFAFFHYGGSLNFGPDGKLYLGTGDRSVGFMDPFNGIRAQDTSLYSGKILRINKDGSVPDGSDGYPANPYINGPGLDEIWAIGLRNPFKATWDLPTGRYFIADVGSNGEHLAVWEDIHICKATSDYAGLNYGWPQCEGPPPFADYPDCHNQNNLADPVYSYTHELYKGCLIGGPIYRGNNFPRIPYFGSYFFGDFISGKIRYITFDSNGNFSSDYDFADGFNGLTTVEQGPDGYLYVMQYSGEVTRITFDTTNALQSCVVAADKRIELHHNTVLSGGVAVADDYGKIALDENTSVMAPGTFARAAEVAVRNGSNVINKVNSPPAMTLPEFEFGNTGNYKNVAVPAYSTVTLAESNYFNITIEKHSIVTFTQNDISINNLDVKDDVELLFVNCAKVKIRNELNLGIGCSFNPEENFVMVFVEENMTVGKSSAVNGNFRVLRGNLNVKKAEPSKPNRMKGQFAANQVFASGYTEWRLAGNRFAPCGFSPVPVSHMAEGESDSFLASTFPDNNTAASAPLKIYPNPFDTRTSILVLATDDSRVKIDACDAAGKILATLYESDMRAGEANQMQLDTGDLPAGIIFIRLQTGSGVYYAKALKFK